jgi:hypothetical protein
VADRSAAGERSIIQAAAPAVRMRASPTIDNDDDDAESDFGRGSPQWGQASTTVLTTL